MGKTVWMIWDGASYPLVLDLLQRGVLPHLQWVVTRGRLVATAPPSPNCETPPGLMTLFTGCEEPDHGIPGFTSPMPQAPHQTVVDTISGFDDRWLRQPPVWVEAVAAGRTVTLVATAFAPEPLQRTVYPWPFPTASYCCVLDGYRHEVAPAQLVPLPDAVTTMTMAGHRVEVRKRGAIRLLSSQEGGWVPLLPFRQPDDLVPLWLEPASGLGAYVAWLREPAVFGTGAQEWLWCSAVTRLATCPPRAWPPELGPFLGTGIGWHFSRGVLRKGPWLAIATLEAITRRVARFFGDLAVWAVTHYPADLVLLYQPALDEIEHQLLREALADWPRGEAARAVITVHQEVDRQLGRLLSALGHEDTVVISSDHGQVPISASLRPNVLLRKADLLTLTGDKVHLERTRALFHSNGWVVINTTDRRGGIVPPHRYADTLQEVTRCLGEAITPVPGGPLHVRHSREVWRGEAPPPGDLFVRGAPEVELRPHLFGPVYGPSEVGGHHQTALHASPSLQAILAGCGPGMTEGPLPARNSGVVALIRRALWL